MQEFGLAKLPQLKGARQDAGRFNKYLRLAGLATLQVTQVVTDDGRTMHTVSLKQEHGERTIPNSLKANRTSLLKKSRDSDKIRQQLANMHMTEIAAHHIQALINIMDSEGYDAATMIQERANIKRVFNYAYKIWGWTALRHNPSSAVVIHKKPTARDRVISNADWEKLVSALEDYGNPYVIPALMLLLETAMRASEALVQATWKDIDWEKNILHLRDAKAGARLVPLGPVAMDVLQSLKDGNAYADPEARILQISYEALKKAWSVACKQCGFEDFRIHDIRHTAATRYAFEFLGSSSLLKVITGHKTSSQLQRYVNIKAEDVASLMHQRGLSKDQAPAGLNIDKLNTGHPVKPRQPLAFDTTILPANVIPLRREKAA